MKALVYTAINELEYKEVEFKEDDIVIKVLASGICGTDLKTYLHGHHHFTPPTILGHEFIGRVEKCKDNPKVKTGDIVAVAPYYECGVCEKCKRGIPELCSNKSYVSTGAFCEYIAVPVTYLEGLFVLPKEKTIEDLAVYTLSEPLACVLTGADRLTLREDSNCLVAGGGPMGILFALYFQSLNIKVSISEPNDERRERLAKWGINVLKPEQVNAGEYDNIVVAVNVSPLISEYVKNIKAGGTILAFSGLQKGINLEIDAYAIHYKEVVLTGTTGFSLERYKRAFEMIKNNEDHFRKLITSTYPLEDGKKAFDSLSSGKDFKVCLIP